MDSKRLKYYQFLLSEGRLPKDINTYTKFKEIYFKDSETTQKFYDWSVSTKQKNRNGYYYEDSIESFYSNYACDLDWAKSTTYCGGSSDINWDSCVNSLTPKKVVGDTIVYKSSDSNYGVVTLKKDHTFTSTGPKYTKGKWSCSSEGKVYLEHTDEVTPGPNPSPSACVATTATGADIISGTLIKNCMKGVIVGEIQKHLKKHGFGNFSRSGNIDNVFGNKTEKMVFAFQNATKGLTPDGVVGPKTWVELVKDKKLTSTTSSTDSSDVEQVDADNIDDIYNL